MQSLQICAKFAYIVILELLRRDSNLLTGYGTRSVPTTINVHYFYNSLYRDLRINEALQTGAVRNRTYRVGVNAVSRCFKHIFREIF